MGLVGKNFEEQLWNYFMPLINNPYGVAALAGNWRAECGNKPNNLQNSFQSKLGHTDESYTAAVDNGSYKKFVRDGAGYGVAQWTYWSRKQGLYNYAKQLGVSIGDTEMQFGFAWKELSTGYKGVLTILKNAKSIKEASDAVLKKYEMPADQGTGAQATRAAYAQEFYDKFSGRAATTPQEGAELSAEAVLDVMRGWLGYSEANGKFKAIIDLYNSVKPLPRSYAVQYDDEWCDTCFSAAGIKAGCSHLIGRECGCEKHIEIFKELGIWEEDGSITPEAGWGILYNWDDKTQPNDGHADHIAYVESVKDGTIVAIEGNKGEAVARRTIPVGWGCIRGYAKIKYPSAAGQGAGTSNNGDTTSSGTTRLCKIPQWVGRVTCDSLNVRSWAGTEFSKIKSWPQLGKGNLVDICDTVKAADGKPWYYIRIDGRIYGFVSAQYIERADVDSTEIKVGDIVEFTGNTHYISANAAKGKACKAGKAKVTQIYQPGISKHPYHLKAIAGGGSTVHGWTNKVDIHK